MDWMISQKMNAEQMTLFLSQVSAAHPEDFIVMVLDGASSHRAKDPRALKVDPTWVG